MRLLRVREVAERLSISRSAAYDLIRRGVIPAVHISERITRVDPAALEAFLQERQRGGVEEEEGGR